MNKILVLIKRNNIIFSTYTKSMEESNLNNTNIIDIKNLKFSEEYIIENLELIASFFNLVVLKSNVNVAIIKNLEIAETILSLLKMLPKINHIIFSENKELSYTLSSLLLENNNIEKIECYNLPEIMFYKFPANQVETRCEILFKSNFMNYNNINTYSKLCNKDKITIDSYSINCDDRDDIIYFFKKNQELKKIIIKGYRRNNLLSSLNLLKENNFQNTTVIIYEDANTTEDIITDIPLFVKLSKQFKVNIKVKYSKEYKEKNCIKELNLILFRNIILVSSFLVLLTLGIVTIKEFKSKQNIEVNLSIIESVMDEFIEDDPQEEVVSGIVETKPPEKDNYVNPYYTNYDMAYSKLLELNNDTVGWLKVKNTKINYPVVQFSDNDYYLKRAFDKVKNNAGWVFADYRNDMDGISKNTIIYAHNLTNGLMFGSLKNVLEESWYSNPDNLTLTFNIKGNKYYWKVFSIYTVEKTNDYLVTDFKSENSFKRYIEKALSRSIADFNEEVKSEDKILTLSTCYNHSNDRLVVHAKML